ncbi:MAG: hypothetical protein FJW31_00670 [Acidobacteria bacterium]|nr:hypothetical protein [Acidobacteriota bacterium]
MNRLLTRAALLLAASMAFASAGPQEPAEDKPSPVPQRGGRKGGKLMALPEYQLGNTETGEAVYFSRKMNGRKAASGEQLDGDVLTAAHPLYPFGSILRVTNTDNNKSIEVRIVDRITSSSSKIISVSHLAAEQLAFIKAGSAMVKVELVALGPR